MNTSSAQVMVTQHFSVLETEFSSTAERLGIDNTPRGQILLAINDAAIQLEKVRELLGSLPLHIDSWYRCPELNEHVGGAHDSAHMQGYAIDFICPTFGTPLQIVQAIAKSGIKYDQVIQEGKWVHISFAPAMRQELLTAKFDSLGRASYTLGIDEGKQT